MDHDTKIPVIIEDRSSKVDELGSSSLSDTGFFPYERHEVTIHDRDGPLRQRYDLVRGGQVVGVLPVDLARGKVVLLEQFRFAAHLATGKGELLEMVAGRVDPGEDADAAAMRECMEEIGVAPHRLVKLYRSMPSPGLTDEIATLYVGFVDSSKVVLKAGLPGESERIHTLTVDIDDALEALENGSFVNSLLIQGLQWLAINREKLPIMTLEEVAS